MPSSVAVVTLPDTVFDNDSPVTSLVVMTECTNMVVALVMRCWSLGRIYDLPVKRRVFKVIGFTCE